MIAFISGLFIGTAAGIAAMCLLIIAKEDGNGEI